MDPVTDQAGSGRFRPYLAKTAGIRSDSEVSDRTLPDSGGICLTLIFEFCKFFVRAKHRKIFSLEMISPKLFYDENYFTLKQTEHR
jgi:hypothetical protein